MKVGKDREDGEGVEIDESRLGKDREDGEGVELGESRQR